RKGTIIDEIVDYIVTLLALGEVLFRVINHVIGTERSDQLQVFRAANAGYFRAEGLGDLDGKCPDTARGTIDQNLLPCLQTRRIAQTLQRYQCSRDRGGLLEGSVSRLQSDGSSLPYANVLGETASP